MIRVNLLPAEYRKAEATPLKQFFATVGAVVLAAIAGLAWAFVYFTRYTPAVDKRTQLKSEIESQKLGVDYTKKLEGKVNDLKAQYKLIDEVAKGRVVWSRHVDELWEMVVSPRTPGRYEVWLDGLSCATTPSGPAAPVGGTMVFSGTSAGAQVARFSDFHEDLSTSAFFQDFKSITPPFGQRTVLAGKDRDPQEGWTYAFTLSLKSLKAITDARAKAAAEAMKK